MSRRIVGLIGALIMIGFVVWMVLRAARERFAMRPARGRVGATLNNKETRMGKLIVSLLSADKLGGWVRALVAALIGMAIAKWPSLQLFATPELQDAVGVGAAGLVVGLWSHVAKKLAAD